MIQDHFISKLFHVAFIIFMMAPLVVIVLIAFTPEGYLALPINGFSLRWFYAMLENPDFIFSFYTSIYLALATATVSLLLTVPASIAITRYRFPGRELLIAILIAPLMVPSIVLGVTFLRFLTLVQLTNGFLGLLLCHVIVSLPFTLRMALSAMTGLDRQVERVALSLGASQFTVFRRITVPLILPGLVGGWMLAFIHSFDELTVTIFVASPSTMTLPVRLFSHISQTTDPLAASVSAVVIAVSAISLLILDRVYGLDRLLLGANVSR